MQALSSKLNNIGNFFKKIANWIKGNLEDGYELAESRAEAAVIIVNKIKEAVENPAIDFWVELTKTGVDNRLVYIARMTITQIAFKLAVAKGILKDSDSPSMALYNVIDHLRSIPKAGRRSWWIEFAAELLGAFMDGKLSFPELVSLTQMVLKKLFPNK